MGCDGTAIFRIDGRCCGSWALVGLAMELFGEDGDYGIIYMALISTFFNYTYAFLAVIPLLGLGAYTTPWRPYFVRQILV